MGEGRGDLARWEVRALDWAPWTTEVSVRTPALGRQVDDSERVTPAWLTPLLCLRELCGLLVRDSVLVGKPVPALDASPHETHESGRGGVGEQAGASF